jgi:hypothetical protein
MSRRDRVVRELMKEYRKLDNSNPNKEEIRKCLLDEMMLKFPQSGQEGWLEAWIDNEFRCELEEKMEAFVSASFPNQSINVEFEEKTIKIDTSKIKIKE